MSKYRQTYDFKETDKYSNRKFWESDKNKIKDKRRTSKYIYEARPDDDVKIMEKQVKKRSRLNKKVSRMGRLTKRKQRESCEFKQ